MTTLAGVGSMEFWTLDPESQSVTVYSRMKGVRHYRGNDPIQVPMFAAIFAVNELFQAS